jgi:hypothetical protein
MRTTLFYRIAAILFILFAAGHTFGFLHFVSPSGAGQTVFAGMNTIDLKIPGGVYTYGGFYRGFGLFVSIYLLFAACVAWHLGSVAKKFPAALGALPWIFFVTQLATMAASWPYFPAPPIVSSVATALFLGAAAITSHSQARPTNPPA